MSPECTHDLQGLLQDETQLLSLPYIFWERAANRMIAHHWMAEMKEKVFCVPPCRPKVDLRTLRRHVHALSFHVTIPHSSFVLNYGELATLLIFWMKIDSRAHLELKTKGPVIKYHCHTNCHTWVVADPNLNISGQKIHPISCQLIVEYFRAKNSSRVSQVYDAAMLIWWAQGVTLTHTSVTYNRSHHIQELQEMGGLHLNDTSWSDTS